MFYWFFDNLSILSKLGLISVDSKEMGKKGSTCWFIALVATFVLTIKNIIFLCLKISTLRKYTHILTIEAHLTQEPVKQTKK